MNKLNKKDFQKKLYYRSKNRGCRETDYILSKFAEQLLFELDEKKLNEFALILDQNDNDLYNWLTEKSPIPSYLNAEIMNKLREFSKN
ncbi:succinate dehydrogenase assembly factor 2 [Rickettsia endosymbiont of Orchestes rusci]|uniref:succinate dehydrogenase assembly factor 2 n=1 Tax=Rickettsia endosymbiont of Orchestes rusci TaxID=3066250 RepID=UPI00209F2FC8|nr:succinate dehydrogenase assembly factor 2 [Rickettsia endosymbiont of Ceutorhynchus assimilis]